MHKLLNNEKGKLHNTRWFGLSPGREINKSTKNLTLC